MGAGAAELLADGALVALAVAEAVLWRAEELVPGCLAGALSQPAVCSNSTNPKSSGLAFIRFAAFHTSYRAARVSPKLRR